MSGICGIINCSGAYTKSTIKEMLKPINDKGCSDIFFSDKDIFVGCRTSNSLPIQNEDESVSLFLDGIIYPPEDLKQSLSQNHTFNSASEAEVFVHLYEERGIETLKNIHGDFAFLLLDKNKEKIFLGKTLANNKNIYYSLDSEKLIFSSQIKSLRKHPNITLSLDYESIVNFLTFKHIPSPHTLFENIKKLGPGEIISWDGKTLNQITELSITPETEQRSEKYFINRLNKTFSKSLEKRVEKCEDFGLFLSGGLDSSMILYFLDKFSDKPINTYTVGLDIDKGYAHKISNYFGTKHIQLEMSSEKLFNIVPKALWFSECPFAGPDIFMYYLSKLSNFKYNFWGQSAEEILFGRKDYVWLDNIQKIKKVIPNSFSILNEKILEKTKLDRFSNLIFSKNPYKIYTSFRKVLTKSQRRKILGEKFRNFNPVDRVRPKKEKLTNDPLKNYSFLTLRNGILSDVFPGPVCNLSNPFLDRDLIELSYKIPSKLKIKNNVPRYLQREMMKDKLPPYLLKRGKSSFYEMTKKWMDEKKSIVLYFIDRLKNRGILKEGWRKILMKSYNPQEKLWSLFNLEVLLEVLMDKEYDKEPPVLSKI